MVGEAIAPDRTPDRAAFDPGELGVIFDAVTDGITVQSADGHVVYANQQAAVAWGYESGAAFVEATGASALAPFELFDDDGRPLDPGDLPGARLLSGEAPAATVVGFRNRDSGEERWAEITATAIRDKRGRITFVVNAFHDITHRKRLEGVVRRHEAEARGLRRQAELAAARADRLQRLSIALGQVTTLEDAIGLVVRRGIRALGARAAAVSLLADDGETLELAAGSRAEGVEEILRSVPLTADRPLAVAVRTRAPVWCGTLDELAARWPEAAARARSVNASALAALPLQVEDELLGGVLVDYGQPQAFNQDQRETLRAIVDLAAQVIHRIRLTEARERLLVELSAERTRLAAMLTERLADDLRLAKLVRAEQSRAAELDAIIGAIGEGIVVVAPDGRLPLRNEAARAIISAAAAGAEASGRPEPDSLADLAALFDDPFPTVPRDLAGGGPYLVRTLGAQARWLEVSAYRVRPDPDASEGETILVLRDVTDLRQRDSIRDSFVGILSHELRTPVTTIYAGAKVLARPRTRLDDETRAGIFEDIHSEAERLHRLVEDVVAITRFGEGALEIGTDPVLLQRVIPAVVRSEEGRWPGGSFDVALPSNLPPVAGDLTYVEQIIRNLLANAMKYGGHSSTARIEAEAGEREVTVRVLDAGPGFDPRETERLFELYYRSPAATRVASGSGIGLFVCARLVEAMGGRIWARNRPDGGAEFGFTLRVVSDDD